MAAVVRDIIVGHVRTSTTVRKDEVRKVLKACKAFELFDKVFPATFGGEGEGGEIDDVESNDDVEELVVGGGEGETDDSESDDDGEEQGVGGGEEETDDTGQGGGGGGEESKGAEGGDVTGQGGGGSEEDEEDRGPRLPAGVKLKVKYSGRFEQRHYTCGRRQRILYEVKEGGLAELLSRIFASEVTGSLFDEDDFLRAHPTGNTPTASKKSTANCTFFIAHNHPFIVLLKDELMRLAKEHNVTIAAKDLVVAIEKALASSQKMGSRTDRHKDVDSQRNLNTTRMLAVFQYWLEEEAGGRRGSILNLEGYEGIAAPKTACYFDRFGTDECHFYHSRDEVENALVVAIINVSNAVAHLLPEAFVNVLLEFKEDHLGVQKPGVQKPRLVQQLNDINALRRVFLTDFLETEKRLREKSARTLQFKQHEIDDEIDVVTHEQSAKRFDATGFLEGTEKELEEMGEKSEDILELKIAALKKQLMQRIPGVFGVKVKRLNVTKGWSSRMSRVLMKGAYMSSLFWTIIYPLHRPAALEIIESLVEMLGKDIDGLMRGCAVENAMTTVQMRDFSVARTIMNGKIQGKINFALGTAKWLKNIKARIEELEKDVRMGIKGARAQLEEEKKELKRGEAVSVKLSSRNSASVNTANKLSELREQLLRELPPEEVDLRMKEEENETSCRRLDSYAATRKLTIKLMLFKDKIGKMTINKVEVEDSMKAHWLNRMMNNEGGSLGYQLKSIDSVVVAGGGKYAGVTNSHGGTFTSLGGAEESRRISLGHLCEVTGVAKVGGPRRQGGKGFHEKAHAIEKKRLRDVRRKQVLAKREARSKQGEGFKNVRSGKFQ
ncbi:hypothetical protein TeGR_g8087 [Tetraparma gracilis]|uniref:Uncharacterized protein n=1 Tax=Tetraparma gracilis TaxID=2962635 RepID=A0ABQ6NAX0_9STRA|nr:hypothetical protein TeGR_g8087 [Tetraparma gracilis]